MKVYVVVQAIKSMFDAGYENEVVGVYSSREEAEKQHGNPMVRFHHGVTIEEHEVK